MAVVRFSSHLQTLTGALETEVKAVSYRDLIQELLEKFPNLKDAGLQDLALALDGELIQEPLLVTFSSTAELHFVPKLAAG